MADVVELKATPVVNGELVEDYVSHVYRPALKDPTPVSPSAPL